MRVLAYNIRYNTRVKSFDLSGQIDSLVAFNNNKDLLDDFGSYFGLGNAQIEGPSELELDCPLIKSVEDLVDNYDCIITYIKEKIKQKTCLEVMSCSLRTLK